MTGGRDSQSNICTFGFTKTKPWTVRAITKFQPAWEKPVEFPWSSGQVISYTVNSHNQADIEGDRVGNISDTENISDQDAAPDTVGHHFPCHHSLSELCVSRQLG